MVELINVTKKYNKNVILNNINIKFNRGEIFGIIGPNGSGKTTLLKIIMKQIEADGNIYYKKSQDYELTDFGYLSQNFTLKGNIKISNLFKTILQNDEELIDRFNYLCNEFKINQDKIIDNLSHIEIKKLGIINAMINNPKVLILDGVLSGLDEASKNTLFKLLKKERKKGTLIIITSTNINKLTDICDRIAPITHSKITNIIDVCLFNSDYYTITIYSKEYKHLELPMKDIIIKKQTEEYIKFLYKGNIKNLFTIVNKIKIDNIIINNATLKDIIKI